MATDSGRYLSGLHRQVDQLFNLEEVRTLCFELGVDFDNVAGEGKTTRIRELILLLARRDELQALVELARKERPNALWADVPTDFRLPGGPETAGPARPSASNYEGPKTYNQQGQTVHGPQINPGRDANIDRVDVHYGMTVEEVAALFDKLKNQDLPADSPPQPFEPELVQLAVRNGARISIGKYAVLAEEYEAFLDMESQHRAPSLEVGWSGRHPLNEALGKPVTGISYTDAEAYCQWIEKETNRHYRLPTVDEWRVGYSSGIMEVAGHTAEWTASTEEKGTRSSRAGVSPTRRMLCKVGDDDNGDGAKGTIKCFSYLVSLSASTFAFRVVLEARSS